MLSWTKMCAFWNPSGSRGHISLLSDNAIFERLLRNLREIEFWECPKISKKGHKFSNSHPNDFRFCNTLHFLERPCGGKVGIVP